MAQLLARDAEAAALQDAATTATTLAMVGRGGAAPAAAALAPLVLPSASTSAGAGQEGARTGVVAAAKLASLVLAWVVAAESAVEGLLGGLVELVECAQEEASAQDDVSQDSGVKCEPGDAGGAPLRSTGVNPVVGELLAAALRLQRALLTW